MHGFQEEHWPFFKSLTSSCKPETISVRHGITKNENEVNFYPLIKGGLIPWKIFFYLLEYYTIFRFQVVKDKSLILNQSLIHVLLPWLPCNGILLHNIRWLRQK
jgi:hypothetical protein